MPKPTPAVKSPSMSKPVSTAKKSPASPAPAKAKPAPTKTAVAPVRAATKPKAPARPAPAKSQPVVAAVAPVVPEAIKPPKEKLVRDGFTFPANEYARIGELKRRAMALGVDTKKSEIVRAGLVRMAALADAEFLAALAAVPKMKTGRKRKEKAA